MIQHTNSRALSAKILEQVCYHHKSLTDVFSDSTLQPKENDRSFVKEICFGTIRYWIYLQGILKTLLERPLKNEDKDIECLLCVGLYQLIFMDIPEYALVNETVDATRELKKEWASGLMNKILRIAIEKKSNDLLKAKGITVEYAHPNWIIDKIKSAWPDDFDAILKANNQKAPLCLRINITKISVIEFKKLLEVHEIPYRIIEGLIHGIILENPLSVENIPGFKEGFFSVQDACGQKVVEYLDLREDQLVLDACAAPGSKTTHILETCSSVKKLIAIDISKNRLSKIQDNIKRLQLPSENVKLITADAVDLNAWWNNELFDRILVDAPCSATGVIRRHPDIKLLRKKTDIKNLCEQQLKILNALWPTLKSAGKLIYTTCSIFPDENEQLIETFLNTHPDAGIIPINNDWGMNLKFGQQVLTGHQNRDGFYYSILFKN